MSPRLFPLVCLGLTAGLSAAETAKGPALQPADAHPPAQNKVTITVKGDKRIIESNGIPDHKVSKFPNRGNPNAIAEQKYHLEVPAQPKAAAGGATGRMMSAWGVALNGVVFDPGTAEVYNDGDRSSVPPSKTAASRRPAKTKSCTRPAHSAGCAGCPGPFQ